MLEGTALALLGILLFQLRRRAGLIPLLFLLSVLALSVPFVAHTSVIDLPEPWTIGRTYVVVLPVFIALTLVLHTLTGPRNAQLAAGMPAAAGGLAATAQLLSSYTPVMLPEAIVPPSAVVALATGALLSIATWTATLLFEWWHKDVGNQAPFAVVLALSALTGLLVHGLLAQVFNLAGPDLPGATWPSVVAMPVVAGMGPVVFIALYADTLIAELAPMARSTGAGHRLIGQPADLSVYREADQRYQQAIEEGQDAVQTYQDLAGGDDQRSILLTDRRGRVVYATAGACRTLQREEEDLVGTDARHLLFGPHTKMAAQPSQTARTVGPRDRIRWDLGPHQPDRVLELDAAELDSGALRIELIDVTEEALRARLADHEARTGFALDLLARDLPNYLVCPATSLEMLGDQVDGDLGPEGHRLIDRATTTLQELSERLRRLEVLQGTGPLEAEPVDVTERLRETIRQDQEAHPGRLSVHWDWPERPVQVEAHPHLAAVLENLVANARGHTGPDPELTVWARREHGGWTIGFDDEGPGVQPELRERIFQGFLSNDDGRGRGLGLAVADLLVQRMGGRLWVEDRLDAEHASAGASFRLWLPGAVPEHGPQEPAPVPVDEAAAADQPAPWLQEDHGEGRGTAAG